VRSVLVLSGGKSEGLAGGLGTSREKNGLRWRRGDRSDRDLMTQRAARPARARGRPKKVRVPPPGEVIYPQRDEDEWSFAQRERSGRESVREFDVERGRVAAAEAGLPGRRGGIWLYQGDCIEVLEELNKRYPEGRFDAIFADPPYFLSNGGITCHAGKMVKVDKGRMGQVERRGGETMSSTRSG